MDEYYEIELALHSLVYETFLLHYSYYIKSMRIKGVFVYLDFVMEVWNLTSIKFGITHFHMEVIIGSMEIVFHLIAETWEL